MKTKNIKKIDAKNAASKSLTESLTLEELIKKGKKPTSSCPEIDTGSNGS